MTAWVYFGAYVTSNIRGSKSTAIYTTTTYISYRFNTPPPTHTLLSKINK